MVRVYSFDIGNLSFEGVLKDFKDAVHPDLIAKARQYKHPGDQHRSLTSALLLRWALIHDFDLYHPYPFPCSENGKPYHTSDGHEFNISHAKNRVVVATSDTPVGIDVEYKRTNRFKVAERFFSPYELEMIRKSHDKDACFTMFWCIKEAFLKYTGTGLTAPLQSFTVIKNNSHFKIMENGRDNKNVRIQYYQDKEDYFYAVCHDVTERFSDIYNVTYDEFFEIVKEKP